MNNLFKITLIFCFTVFYHIASAQDITGEWYGILRQEEGGVTDYYNFTLNLIQDGNNIKGTSIVNLPDNPDFFAIMELKGRFKDDVLTFSESKIINQKTYNGLEWCIKKSELAFTFKKGGFCMEGNWSGVARTGDSCTPGTIKLCKIVPMAKKEIFKTNN